MFPRHHHPRPKCPGRGASANGCCDVPDCTDLLCACWSPLMLLAVPGDGLRREGSGSGDAARGHRRKSPPPGCLRAANVSWRRRAIWPVSRPGWRGRSAWTRPGRDGRASGTRPARPCWWISRPRTWPGHGSMMCSSTGKACRSPPWRCVSAISMACLLGELPVLAGSGRCCAGGPGTRLVRARSHGHARTPVRTTAATARGCRGSDRCPVAHAMTRRLARLAGMIAGTLNALGCG
jgi:hypothetical protein